MDADKKKEEQGVQLRGGERQIIGWVQNMQFGHEHVSEKVEKSCVEVSFEGMIGNPRQPKNESSDKQRKRDPGTSSNIKALGKMTLEIKKFAEACDYGKEKNSD